MALDEETINAQLDLLATHRRTLAVYLRQQAELGVLAPPGVINGIAEAQSAIRDIKEQLRAADAPVGDEPNDNARPAASAAPTRLSPQEQRNRRAMLQKVKIIWIDGLLEQSLAKELRIALDLIEQPDAVDLPLNALVQELNRAPQPIPPGASIIDMFDQTGGALLILGAPGSGKTTLLLELARDLIVRAEQDESFPIPVVFNLSSWAARRRPLTDWLAEELNARYDAPRKLAQEWIDTDVVLPLLDGLDEVAAEHRGDCVAAINTYRQAHGLAPLAVSSRVADYQSLGAKLRLGGAVVVQPLTAQQVGEYVRRAGEDLAAAARDDGAFGDLLDTPLMLSILQATYSHAPPASLQDGETIDQRRLFDAYLAAMFQRRSKNASYSPQQIIRWLGWVALKMTRQSQTVLLVERLQPDWLSTRAGRLQYALLDRLGFGLICGLFVGSIVELGFGTIYRLVVGLIGGVIVGLIGGLVALLFGGRNDVEALQQRRIGRIIADALVGGAAVGLVSGAIGGAFGRVLGGAAEGPLSGMVYEVGGGAFGGLLGGLVGGLMGILTGKPGVAPRRVMVVERLRWSGGRAWRSAASGLVGGLAYGVVVGTIVGLVVTLDPRVLNDLFSVLLFDLIIGLMGGVIFGLGGALLGGLVGGLGSGPLTTSIQVNEGIRRSARSALVGGAVGGLIFGLIAGLVWGLLGGLDLGLVIALVFGLVGGLAGALAFGGYACLSHMALRLVLAYNGSLPLRLVPFLDYCAERIFLRKVGGGYIFVHRLLMEHFASLYNEQTEADERDGAVV